MQNENNEIAIITPPPEIGLATIREVGDNYKITSPAGDTFTLRRDVDFGKPNAKLKQPVIYKGGCENIRKMYRVFDRYELIDNIKDHENGFFYFMFKCSLVAVHENRDIVVAEGYGSANTREANVGNASGFDVANSKLKIARKRAMVDAVITMAGLSSIFTQDIENDDFMTSAKELVSAKPDDAITAKQRQRIFAIGANAGMSQEAVRTFLKAKGFVSTKNIKQSDYDALCAELGGVTSGAAEAK